MAPHSSTLAWRIPWMEEPGVAAVHGVAKSQTRLSDPMDCSLPGSSVHGTSQARVLEWGAIAFSFRDLLSNCSAA